MKKSMIRFSMLMLLLFTFSPLVRANVINNNNDIHKYATVNFIDIDVNFTITSSGGCKFTVDGTITTSWGEFVSFNGTVTASGGEGCPNDTWTFGMVVYDDGSSKLY